MSRIARTRAVLLLAVLASLILAQVATAAMEPGDFNEALARAKAEDKPLVIDFYTDW
jgi:thiamine pyrophosphate-dependent acetolactate synthase large subunit-like protein